MSTPAATQAPAAATAGPAGASAASGASATSHAATMTAVVNDRYGEPDRLSIARVPVPRPAAGEILVRVHAAALNPADVFMLRGRPALVRLSTGLARPSPRHRVRGNDLAGVVVAVGPVHRAAGADDLRVGDRVFGSTAGALAEYACGRQQVFAALPATVSFEEAAALPMAGLAALHGLRDAARLTAGQHLLVNGASGGIGTFAVQIAKAMGARVTAVCSRSNVELVRGLGADDVIAYTETPLTSVDGRYDVILDNVGNHRLSELRALLTPGGTLLTNSGEPGPDGGPIVRILKATVMSWRSRERIRPFFSSPNAADLAVLAGMVERGELRPVIERVLPLERAGDAMAHVASRRARGKVVIGILPASGFAAAST